MLIGTQYYRPPNPEPELWEADMRQIAALGMSLIRCWVYWRTVEPAADDWVWDDYDRFMDLAAVNDLGVVIQLIPECQPEWFLQDHRALWPRRADGRVIGQAGYSMVTPGGYPGIFYDHPEVVTATARFYRAVAERYADHPALRFWDVWNEIQPHGGIISYDEVTARRWRDYLRERFGDIATLNRRCLCQYADFEQIALPELDLPFQGPQHWLAIFHDFRFDRLRREMERRAALVREQSADRPIMAHAANTPICNQGQNDWLLADCLDAYGTSQYLDESRLAPGADYVYAALYYGVTRSIAAGKPWWLSEHAGGPIYYHYGHCNRTDDEVQANLLIALAQGAEAALFWQYRHERLGEEASGWGLVNFDGTANVRTEAVARVAQAIARGGDDLRRARRPAAAVGVLTDHRATMYEARSQEWVPQAVAARHEAEQTVVSLLSAGIATDILHQARLTTESLAELRLLVLPMSSTLDDTAIALLQDWVAAGGTLLATAYTGLYDADGYVGRILPRPPLDTLFGLRVLTRHYPTTPFELQPTSLELADLPALTGRHVLEELHVADADVMAECLGQAAVTRRRHGKGEAWYLATCPGQADDRDALRQWLLHLAASQQIRPWFADLTASDGSREQAHQVVLGEQLIGADSRYLVLVNSAHSPRKVVLQLPLGEALIDLGGDAVMAAEPDGSMAVDLPPRGSVLLRCRR